MKKTLLTLIALFIITSTADAAPRFGVAAEQDSGFGAVISDDLYSAQVFYASVSSDDDANDYQAITGAFDYNIALDSGTDLTAGVAYKTVSGTKSSNTLDTYTELAVVAGIARELTADVVVNIKADIYNLETVDTGTEVKTTSLFSNGRIGVSYLF